MIIHLYWKKFSRKDQNLQTGSHLSTKENQFEVLDASKVLKEIKKMNILNNEIFVLEVSFFKEIENFNS